MKARSKAVVRVMLVTVVSMMSIGIAKADAFEEGIRHFKAGKYQQAIRSFRRAEQTGNKRPALYYNLGVSYFRTGQYARAEQYFLRAEQDARFSQLAQYNLGLVALKRGRKDAALKWFLRASRSNGDPRVTAIANQQIDRLQPGLGFVTSRAGLRVGVGNDNNVLLLPDNSPSRQGDTYFETWLYGSMRLGKRFRVGGSWYQRDYSDLAPGDYDAARVRADYLFAVDGWKLEAGAAIANSTLGSRHYLQITDLVVQGRRSLGASRVKLRYRYSDIGSRSAVYDYLAGSRHQFRAEYFTAGDHGQLRYRYQLELNDRRDRATASYSPTRHDLRVRLRRDLGGPWRMEVEGQYRLSNYPSLAGVTRRDNRLRLRAGVDYRLGNGWILNGRVTYTNNDSNVAAEDYVRTDWQINARMRF